MRTKNCDKCNGVIPEGRYDSDYGLTEGEYPEVLIGSGGVDIHTYDKHKTGKRASWREVIGLDLCKNCLPRAHEAIKDWLAK